MMASVIGAGAASAQDQSAATPKDAIFARKILMSTVGDNMDELEGMAQSPKPIDMDEAHEHADIVSVLLQLFPHIFPPATNQWRPGVTGRDPGTDTYASPEVWTHFSDFYKRATEASQIAFRASRAANEAEFRRHVTALRQACDGCHAAYQKTE
jgi:cytochrome c556